jgi:hypothetical protein
MCAGVALRALKQPDQLRVGPKRLDRTLLRRAAEDAAKDGQQQEDEEPEA